MKNKRLFALLLTLLMVLTMSACGREERDAQIGSGISGNDTLSAEKNDSPSAAVKSDGYEKFSQLKIGMTESDVHTILGDLRDWTKLITITISQ